MVKQTKTFKKGNVTKKALSAILAASMVMTSSSFVMAAPQEVAVESVDTQVVEEVEALDQEENVKATTTITTIQETSGLKMGTTVFTYAKESISGLLDAVKAAAFQVETGGNTSSTTVADILEDTKYKVIVTNPQGKEYTITDSTADATMPHAVGTYTLTVKGTQEEVSSAAVIGSVQTTYTINDDAAVEAQSEITLDNQDIEAGTSYTGQEIRPELKLKLKETSADDLELKQGTDYDIVEYKDNRNAGTAKIKVRFKGAYVARGEKEYTFTIKKAVATADNVKIKVNNPEVIYNAGDQEADLTVQYTPEGATAPVTLVKDVDYTVDDGVKKDVGDHTVTVKLNQTNFEANQNEDDQYSAKATFKIKAQDFNEKTVNVILPDVYTDAEKKNNISKDNIIVRDAATGKALAAGDYTVKFSNEQNIFVNTAVDNGEDNAGKTFAVKIEPNGANYKSGTEILKYYTITKLDETTLANYLKKHTFYLQSEVEYSPDGVLPSLYIDGQTVDAPENGGEKAVVDGVCKAVFPAKKDSKELGEYKIRLVGLGAYAGQETEVAYKVVPKDASANNAVTGADSENIQLAKMTNGTEVYAKKLVIKDTDDKQTELVRGVDYDYEISSTNVMNQASIVITFKGNYKGTITHLLEVTSQSKWTLESDIIQAYVVPNYVYDGAPKTPAATDISVTAVVDGKSIALVPGRDFELDTTYNTLSAYKDNTNVGEATVRIKAAEGSTVCDGTRVIKFQITATPSEKENYIVDVSKLKSVYDLGSAFAPKNDIVVRTKAGRVLTSGTDYTVTYYRDGKEVNESAAAGANAKVGTVNMKVTIKATKTDVLETSYRIATSLEKVAEIPKTFADEKYTGSAIEPAVDLKKMGTGIPLVKDKDYTVTYANNVKAGTATVTIQGIGDYYGTYVSTFNITGEMDQEMEVLAAQERDLGNGSRTLNSKATKIKFTKEPVNKPTYKSSNEDVVTVDAEGNLKYTGIGEATITVTAPAGDGYKEATKEVKVVVTLAKPSFTPFSRNNAFTLTSSTVKGAEKFEVEYATKKNFSNSKTETFTTTSAGKVKQVKVNKLGDKKTYFVRVRAVSGTTKSAWSAVKTVATK